MAAHQALLSLGFSRQEHWSGLPFPSPMHESESEVPQSCPTLSNPMECSPPGSSVHGIFQARVLEWSTIAFSDVCVCIYIYTHTYTYIYIYIWYETAWEILILTEYIMVIISYSGTSLVEKWLRICLSVQGIWVWSLVRELRSYKPCGTAKK